MHKKQSKVINEESLEIQEAVDKLTNPQPEVIRLIADDEPEDFEPSVTTSIGNGKKTPVEKTLFESDILVNKLEGQSQHELGRGFRSKDLTEEDLKIGKIQRFDLEDQWTENTSLQEKWVKKLVVLGMFLVVLLGGWVFYKVKSSSPNIDTKYDEIKLIAERQSKIEQELVSEEKIVTTITGFLTAKTMEERLKWSRKPDQINKKIKEHRSRDHEFLSYKKITVEKQKSFLLDEVQTIIATVKVSWVNKDNQEEEESKSILLVNLDGEYLVDWASFVGFQPDDYRAFIKSKSVIPATFRAQVKSNVDVGPYLYSFSDDSKYQAYRVSFKDDDENYLYAYARLDSEEDNKLKKLFTGVKNKHYTRKIMLTLAFPENSETDKCVEIMDVFSEHWFVK